MVFIYYNNSNRKYYLNYYDFQDNRLYFINYTSFLNGVDYSKIIPVDYNNDGLLDLLFVKNYYNNYVLLLNQGAFGEINTFYTHSLNQTNFPYFFKINNSFFYTFTFNNTLNKELIENYYSKNYYNFWLNFSIFKPIWNCNYYDFYYECRLKGLKLDPNYFLVVGNLTNANIKNLFLKPVELFWPYPKGNLCYYLMQQNLTIEIPNYFNCSDYFGNYLTNYVYFWFLDILNKNKVETKKIIVKSWVS